MLVASGGVGDHVLDGLDTGAVFHRACEFVLRGVSFSVMHAGALLRACVLLDPCDVLRVVERLACVAQVA